MNALAALLGLAMLASGAASGAVAGAGPAAVQGAGASADTIVEMRRGDRIALGNLSGAVVLEAWDEDRLEVRTSGPADALVVRRSASELRVLAASRAGGPRRVDAVLRVPVWADVAIQGIDLDVRIEGLGGAVSIRTVSGDVRVAGTTGEVRVRAVEGEIIAERASGNLVLSSQADDVRVTNATGRLDVRSGSGDLVLERVDAPSVRAETQDGDIRFSGPLAADGAYRFFVHDGDVVLELPETVGAEVRVSTFDGEFRSDFPVVVPSFTSGRAFEFTLGAGGGELTIEVFDGEIRILRGRDP